MVRTYKRKTDRGTTSENLHHATKEVLNEHKSFRTVAVAYGIDKMTLYRHCRKIKASQYHECNISSGSPSTAVHSGYAKPRQLLSDAEEAELVKYLLDASKMFFGLSPKETRKLAFQFATDLGKPVPEKWKITLSAGEDWFSGFMCRHCRLISLRTPEATSLSRISSFNQTNASLFYDNLESLYSRFHFEPQSIWNVDETGLTTVQNPGKVIAPKGMKQVGAVTSAERGVLVALCCAVNALGHAIPPMFVFPMVRYHERLVDGGPPGCVRASHKSGWMTKENISLYFYNILENTVILSLNILCCCSSTTTNHTFLLNAFSLPRTMASTCSPSLHTVPISYSLLTAQSIIHSRGSTTLSVMLGATVTQDGQCRLLTYLVFAPGLSS